MECLACILFYTHIPRLVSASLFGLLTWLLSSFCLLDQSLVLLSWLGWWLLSCCLLLHRFLVVLFCFQTYDSSTYDHSPQQQSLKGCDEVKLCLHVDVLQQYHMGMSARGAFNDIHVYICTCIHTYSYISLCTVRCQDNKTLVIKDSSCSICAGLFKEE